jgi:hypothetical protein
MNRWDSIEFDYPSVPTMISREETRYLYWLAARYWTNSGHIIEIGPWLGGSTICLASGMRDRDQFPENKLHVFDNFIWRDFMAERASLPLRNGDSFQSKFEGNLASFGDLIRTHRRALPDDPTPLDKLAESLHTNESGNIETLTWDLGEPVEILFVDGAKSWTGFKHLLQVFSESLIPGKSLLVCQDYKFWGSYWVPMMLEYFSEYFELVHNVAQNTVSFMLNRAIPAAMFDSLPGYRGLETKKGNELLERASQRLLKSGDQLGASILQACKIRYRINMGETDSAVELFRNLEAEWPLNSDCQTISQLRNWLREETGVYLPPTIRWRCVLNAQKLRNSAKWLRRQIVRIEWQNG